MSQAKIDKSSVSKVDFECVARFVNSVLPKIYLEESTYEALFRFDQLFAPLVGEFRRDVSSTEFDAFWGTRNIASEVTSNVCIAFDWYKLAVEPVVYKPFGDTIVGRSRDYRIPAVVIASKEAAMGIIEIERISIARGIQYNAPVACRKRRINCTPVSELTADSEGTVAESLETTKRLKVAKTSTTEPASSDESPKDMLPDVGHLKDDYDDEFFRELEWFQHE